MHTLEYNIFSLRIKTIHIKVGNTHNGILSYMKSNGIFSYMKSNGIFLYLDV